jgi:hypothetical protein
MCDIARWRTIPVKFQVISLVPLLQRLCVPAAVHGVTIAIFPPYCQNDYIPVGALARAYTVPHRIQYNVNVAPEYTRWKAPERRAYYRKGCSAK